MNPGNRPHVATPVPSVTTEVVITAIGDATTTPRASKSDAKRDAKASVFRIAPDGLWDTLWESADDLPYDVVADGEGSSSRRATRARCTVWSRCSRASHC